MAGLYNTALMDEDKTNAHWKREQDNYLSQIGAMDLIKKDPMARLGYDIRSANENKTLDMGSNIDAAKYYGLYKFMPSRVPADIKRRDGTMDVTVELPPQHYGATIAHELGHVGSRNSQTDDEINSDPMGEERRQRLVDYVNNPPGSQMSRDALWFLWNQFGLDSMDKVEAAADEVRASLGTKPMPSKPAPKPAEKKQAPAKKKKKKAPAGTNSLKDD
jgi:hypothetical protein